MDISIQEFRKEVIKYGILSHSEQQTLYGIAKQCAKKVGVPAAGGGLIVGSKADAVTVPVIGAVPGAVAGFLAGLVGGTAACTAANMIYRSELKKLASE